MHENNSVTFNEAEKAVITLIKFIGEDPDREGLKETPARFLKAWIKDWGRGYSENPSDHIKLFTEDIINYNEMILVKDIPLYSHCEHHIAPIIGKAHIAYIPEGKVIGLSKIVRIVNTFSRRLQIQEKLTTQIAEALNAGLNPKGVAVVIEAEHFCMCSRGVKEKGSLTVTSKLIGDFLRDNSREEFLSLIRSR